MRRRLISPRLALPVLIVVIGALVLLCNDGLSERRVRDLEALLAYLAEVAGALLMRVRLW